MFDPETVKAPAPPLFNVGYEKLPPAKVFAKAEVIEIVPEPDVLKFDPLTVQLAPEIAQELPPNVIALKLDPVEENVPVDTGKPFELIVPAVNVNNLVDPNVKASCKFHAPPIPLNVTGQLIVFPLLVIV